MSSGQIRGPPRFTVEGVVCRQAVSLAPDHMAGRSWSWDSNPGQTGVPAGSGHKVFAAVDSVALGRPPDLPEAGCPHLSKERGAV